jgi:hypothetical protein
VNAVNVFWNASLEELKQGYLEQGDRYVCLLCGREFEKGIVYPEDGVLYEAGRYIRFHIEKVHHSVFEYLIEMDKKLTGLTDHQKSLLELFYQGKSDKEIQQELGIGSVSTIRNHRFVLKEKERQCRLFLAMMELLKEKDEYAPAILNVPKEPTMLDGRYDITMKENREILTKYFPQGSQGPLKAFPGKEKPRLIILRELAARFHRGRIYSEKEVNGILEAAYEDHVLMRRYLIDYGFLDREPDGSQYWVKD